ncbi:nitroreductase [Sinobacterium caligoides]|uniref:Nitroreductase n=1 Tax=Sinobacterium caligoides TaxID=933926 RepID=A0A3N2DH09_9GAMM|nr:nitroreductase [Sinobacterium caligoides]ROR99062.1 nitroreductase [Sinobacterium caligoides]
MMNNDLSTAFTELVTRRRSVRGFLPTAVEQPLLERVFELAQRSPSNCNTQPWQVYVASGEVVEALRRQLPEAMMSGHMELDFPFDGVYQGEYKCRQHDAAAQLYQAMGIERGDKAGRGEAFMRNFHFFGAPHVAFLFLHQDFAMREAADLGMYAQNLMLSLSAHGLASCPMTALSFHSGIVRAALDVPDDYKLLFGIALGYEDEQCAANRCRVGRAPLSEAVHFRR